MDSVALYTSQRRTGNAIGSAARKSGPKSLLCKAGCIIQRDVTTNRLTRVLSIPLIDRARHSSFLQRLLEIIQISSSSNDASIYARLIILPVY